MAVFANLVGRLSLDSTAFDRNAKRSSQSMRAMQRESLALQKGIVQLAGAYYAFRTSARMVQSLTREAVTFEYQMAKVNTMLDKQTEHYLPRLGAGMRQLAVEYGESLQSLTDGMYNILSAQIDAAKATDVLESSVRAAKGGFTDAAVTTKAMVGLLNAYQLEAKDAARVADFLHSVVFKGLITFEELAEHIGKVSSLAAVLGVDMEAMGASIATITKAGVPAEIAMTALRSILSTFKNPTDEAKAAAAELGFQLDATSIRGAGLIEVMQKLKDANAAQLDALMPTMRGVIGLAAAMKNVTGLTEAYRAILEGAGRSQEAWNKVADTAQIRGDKLRQRWAELKIALGEPIADFAITWLEHLANGLDITATSARNARAAWNEWVETQRLAPPMGTSTGGNWGAWPQPGEEQERQAAIERWARTLSPQLRPAAETIVPTNLGMEWNQYVQQDRLKRLGEAFKGGWYESRGLKRPKKPKGEAETATKTTTDIAAAYRRMYNDLDRKSEESWQVRRDLLAAEYREYASTLRDKELALRWFHEQQIKLAREEAIVTGSLGEGFAARIQQMKDELQTIGELGAELATNMRDDLVGALTDATFRARDLGEALEQAGIALAKMAYEWGLQQLFAGGMGLLFHGGGKVGGGVQVRRPAPVPVAAPRFHGGGEVPAWLLPGEKVQSRREVGAADRSMSRVVQLLERIAGRAEDGGTTVIVARTPDEVHEAMGSREGRRIIVDAARRAGMGRR